MLNLIELCFTCVFENRRAEGCVGCARGAYVRASIRNVESYCSEMKEELATVGSNCLGTPLVLS